MVKAIALIRAGNQLEEIFMKTHLIRFGVTSGACVLLAGAAAMLGGCASNEPVGYQKTTTKTTTDTPAEKTTVTETREKNTTITPR